MCVLRKSSYSKLALLVGLALTVSTTAGAWTLSLVQVGGTYDGVGANPGDTLVLSIEYSLDDSSVILVESTITWDAAVRIGIPRPLFLSIIGWWHLRAEP
jgi:hypothetical protein